MDPRQTHLTVNELVNTAASLSNFAFVCVDEAGNSRMLPSKDKLLFLKRSLDAFRSLSKDYGDGDIEVHLSFTMDFGAMNASSNDSFQSWGHAQVPVLFQMTPSSPENPEDADHEMGPTLWKGPCRLCLPIGCVIFNLALLHHQRGSETQNRSLLDKACRLYEKAIESIQSALDSTDRSDGLCKLVSFLSVISAMHIADVHVIMQNHGTSQEALKWSIEVWHRQQQNDLRSSSVEFAAPSLLDTLYCQVVSHLLQHTVHGKHSYCLERTAPAA